MPEPILSVRNLTKSYGDYLAVDHISFDIHEGKILGLLGPNGAGKSTTIQMLLGLTETDAGEIFYFGKNFAFHREYCLSRINFASTYSELNSRMTVNQNLLIYAGLYNIRDTRQRIKELLEILEVEECRDKLFWHLSSGQKTRVILAKALLNRPKMLLMDEPTASLDPDIVFKIIKLIKDLQEREKITILYTSHNMDEVSRLCDTVAFLAKGKIAVIDTPLELTKKLGSVALTLSYDGEKESVAQFLQKRKLSHEFLRKDLVEIFISETDVPDVLFALQESGVLITTINTEKPSLEDVFLHISKTHAL
jgi:ABC-2 type transport system ATP-binding protein